MFFRYGLLLPAVFVALLFVGSVSAVIPIPSPPYTPRSPSEDIVTVSAYYEQASVAPPSPGGTGTFVTVHITITFAAPTPPTGHTLYILLAQVKGDPPTEEKISAAAYTDSAKTTYTYTQGFLTDSGAPTIIVYAWLDTPGTDRAPNDGFYSITSLSSQNPNVFQDPEGSPVGGVVLPTSKLDIVAPLAALAGLIAAVSTVVAVKKRRD